MSLTVIIPLRNEEAAIVNTLKYFEESWIINIDHEILLIDDFSIDNTCEKINSFNSSTLNFKTITNKKKGLGSAIKVGIESCSKKYVAIFMADLSDDIDDLKKYYDIIKEKELDAVFGSRFINNSHIENYPTSKYYFNRIANNIIKIIFDIFFSPFFSLQNIIPLLWNLDEDSSSITSSPTELASQNKFVLQK